MASKSYTLRRFCHSHPAAVIQLSKSEAGKTCQQWLLAAEIFGNPWPQKKDPWSVENLFKQPLDWGAGKATGGVLSTLMLACSSRKLEFCTYELLCMCVYIYTHIYIIYTYIYICIYILYNILYCLICIHHTHVHTYLLYEWQQLFNNAECQSMQLMPRSRPGLDRQRP